MRMLKRSMPLAEKGTAIKFIHLGIGTRRLVRKALRAKKRRGGTIAWSDD